MRSVALTIVAALSCACGPPPATAPGDGGDGGTAGPDAGTRDAGATDAGFEDGGARDAGRADAGPDAGPLDGGSLDAGWPPDAGSPDAGPCPALAALVPTTDGGVCVDLYEGLLILLLPDGGTAAWPFNQPVDGLAVGSYLAVPAAGEKPQGYVSADQGQAACQASGKRLCRRDEWMAACQGPSGWTYPYGDTYQAGACNEGRATNPVIDLFGAGATFDATEMNDPRLDTLPNTVAAGGAFTQCVSAYGLYDMHGNVEEWIGDTTSTGHGIFKGGYFVDATINGPGCTYTTTAHATSYHDYSTGFRCCADPAF